MQTEYAITQDVSFFSEAQIQLDTIIHHLQGESSSKF